MQELLRFYAIRASDPVPTDEHVALETSSHFQAGLHAGNTPETMAAVARLLLEQDGAVVLRDLEFAQNAFAALEKRLRALQPSEWNAPVDQ